MERTRLFSAALLGSALTLGSFAALVPSEAFAQRAGAQQEKEKAQQQQQQPTGDTVRPEVGKPLQEAQALLKSKNFKGALAKINEADKVGQKTAYEDFVVEQMRFVAALQSGDLGPAERALESLEKGGRLDKAQQLQFMQALAGNYYNQKDYGKAANWAERYLKAGGTDQSMKDVAMQAQFLGGDMAAAGKAVRAQIAAAEKAGKPPEKTDLEILANVGLKSKDDATYLEALEKLVRYYPTKPYWQDLLVRTQRKPGFNRDRLSIDTYRLMNQVNLLERPDDYLEYAQLAIQQGAPGEAKTIVDRGYANNILGQGAEAERHKRLRDLVARSIAEDQKTLDSTAKEAEGRKDGGPLARVAEAYAGYGQYDKAIAAMEKALAKGGLRNPEDARLRLGTYYLAAGNKAKAEQTFKAVKGKDGTADLARLWLLSMSGKPA